MRNFSPNYLRNNPYKGVIFSLYAFLFDSGHETARFRLDPYAGSFGLQIPAGQWHTLVALQPSVIVEFKDGKFAPMEKADVWEG